MAALGLVAAGCDGGGDGDGGGGGEGPATTVTTSLAGSARIDWGDPETTVLEGGWAVADAEGEAPLLDVLREGERVGQLELAAFPLDSLPEVAAALRRGERAALEAQARVYFDTFTADRAAGCGRGYRLERIEPRVADAADGLVVRYGFRGRLGDDRPSDGVTQWAGVRERHLVLVTATSNEPDGCFGESELVYFRTDDLDAFEPLLEGLVRASRFPGPAAARSG